MRWSKQWASSLLLHWRAHEPLVYNCESCYVEPVMRAQPCLWGQQGGWVGWVGGSTSAHAAAATLHRHPAPHAVRRPSCTHTVYLLHTAPRSLTAEMIAGSLGPGGGAGAGSGVGSSTVRS
jgi:hypothetical protein